MGSEMRFVRKEGKDGKFEGFQAKGELKAGDEQHLAAALEIMAKKLRLRVDNDRREEPLTPKQIDGMAEATVMLEEVLRDFILMDVDQAREVLKKIKEFTGVVKSGR